MPYDDIDDLRAELRRLWLAATQGRWTADILSTGQNHLFAVKPDGGMGLRAMPNRGEDARTGPRDHGSAGDASPAW